MTTPHIEYTADHIIIHDPIAHLDRDDPDTFCDECRGIATRQFNAMADLPGGPVDGDYVTDLVRRMRETAEDDAEDDHTAARFEDLRRFVNGSPDAWQR